jgi:hypothetical protein
MENPYSKELAGGDPLLRLGETPRRVRERLDELGVSGAGWTYAPGKWTARQIVVHLAHFEIVAAGRIRMALSEPRPTTQNFDQDAWLLLDRDASAPDAYAVYAAVRRMTLALAARLSDGELARGIDHHMFGAVNVRWLLAHLAGHELRHLAQLRDVRP